MSYKRWIIVAVCLFGIGFGIGLAVPVGLTDILSEDMDAFRELAALLVPFQVSTAVFILAKNISVVLFSFMLSPILCLFPVMSLVFNGMVISFISAIVVQKESVGFVLAGLLPHGIFELPAFIIGEAAALSFGAMVITLLLRKQSRETLLATVKQDAGHILRAVALFFIIGPFHTTIVFALLKEETRIPLINNLKQNLRYLVIAFALLLPAAIIETYVTPLFLSG